MGLTERSFLERMELMEFMPSRAVTNADRIRAMNDEELAEFFGTLPCCPPGEELEELCFPLDSCEGTNLMAKCWLKWLKEDGAKKDGRQKND